MIPMGEVGVPDYYPEISRKLGDIEHPNLIYPVSDQIFVHIYPNREDPRNYYLAVEPQVGMDLDHLLREVERRLLDYVDILAQAQTLEERIAALCEGGGVHLCREGRERLRRRCQEARSLQPRTRP